MAPYAKSNFRYYNEGSSQSDAAYDAWDIFLTRQERGVGTTDGSYWVRPKLYEPAFQVYCLFSRYGSHWMKAVSHVDNTSSSVGSATFGPTWDGWRSGGYYTGIASQNWNVLNNSNMVSPVYGGYPMGKFMCTRNSDHVTNFVWSMDGGIDQGDIILDGHRCFPSLMSCINNHRRFKVNLHHGDIDVIQNDLYRRGDTNVGWGGGQYCGFNMNSDAHSANYNDAMVGGATAGGWSHALVGTGRDNTNSNSFGGGFGCASLGHNGTHTFSGHWWGHGNGRNSSAWSSDISGGVYGHTFWVSRK